MLVIYHKGPNCPLFLVFLQATYGPKGIAVFSGLDVPVKRTLSAAEYYTEQSTKKTGAGLLCSIAGITVTNMQIDKVYVH